MPDAQNKLNPTLGFGGAFYLNLEDRPDRRSWIEAELARVGIVAEKFKALRGVPGPAAQIIGLGHVGCILSHRAMVTEAKRRDWKSVLIFEDDAAFLPDFQSRVDLTVRELRDHRDWDLFYFERYDGRTIETFKYIERISGTLLTHAYAVSAAFYDRYLQDIVLAEKKGVDVQLANHHNARVYAVKTPLVMQRNRFGVEVNDSDILHRR